jgi:hypothetical protein
MSISLNEKEQMEEWKKRVGYEGWLSCLFFKEGFKIAVCKSVFANP